MTFRRRIEPPPPVGEDGLVLEVEAALNCDPASVRVVDDPGFGPSPEGFAIRAEAREVGLFMVRGSYRLHHS